MEIFPGQEKTREDLIIQQLAFIRDLSLCDLKIRLTEGSSWRGER